MAEGGDISPEIGVMRDIDFLVVKDKSVDYFP
jgi:hypothetical protein